MQQINQLLVHKRLNFKLIKSRAGNSTRIRELLLAMILVTFWYENQFLSLNCVPNVLIILNLILANSNKFPPLKSEATKNLCQTKRHKSKDAKCKSLKFVIKQAYGFFLFQLNKFPLQLILHTTLSLASTSFNRACENTIFIGCCRSINCLSMHIFNSNCKVQSNKGSYSQTMFRINAD